MPGSSAISFSMPPDVGVSQSTMTNRPMTVLQLLPNLESGGVERGTLEVAEELVRCGHRSLVVSGGGRLVAALEWGGSVHIPCQIGVKSPLVLRHVATLRRIIRGQQVDILHARSRVPAWIAWLAWRSLAPSCRPRLVTTVHGMHSVNRFSEIMTRGEVVIAVSNSVRDYVLSNFPHTDPRRIHVIHRGVEPREFPWGFQPTDDWVSRWEDEFPGLRGKALVTLPGRLTRLKGHLEFVELIARLKSAHPNVHGLIVGDEDPRRQAYAQQLRQRIAELGMSSDMTFTGHRADIREVYAVSTLVLSLSAKPESFGRTVLEALSLGVPVVGYDHGGVGEILRAAFPAGAVPQGDSARLLQTVGSVLRGAAPPVSPVSGFRLDQMLSQTISLYESLCDDRLQVRGRAA